ncbi:endo-1,4-beta-xylanase [Chroococcidiopsis cubana]|nr:endo-1,4-beta-xylanase [Chroococcidiopsis cubana]
MGTSIVADELSHLSNQIQEISDRKGDFTVIRNTPLRKRATAKGLIYGATSQHRILSSDKKFAARFAQECAILVPEGELKWRTIHPSPNYFNFKPGDWMVEFAHAHGMLFRGHTLVWHGSLPRWFADTVNSRNVEQILLKHITTVAGHYAGKIHSWDVVNEAIHPPHGRTDGLRNTPWLQLLGPNYIDIAFRAAAKADPQALLVYNDFGLDGAAYQDELRRTAVLKLLERLKSVGTPVHALGIQAHWWGGVTRLDSGKLKAFLRDVADLDLKIMITEMDVTDKKLPKDVILRDRIVAGIYEDYLSVVLDEPAVIAVLTWGLSDRYTWLSKYQPRKDRAPVRPLPLDAQLNRKLAWNAIGRAFDNAPKR